MRGHGRTLAFALCSLVLLACDDDPPDASDCSDIQSPCDSDGERRCTDTGSVEACLENDEGCLLWEDQGGCGDRQQCGDGVCACQDDCEAEESRCDGELLIVCSRDDDGCLFEENLSDCSSMDQSCEIIDSEAMCIGCETDLCDEAGLFQCAGNVVQTCVVDAEGCLDWEDTTDCAALDPPQRCSDEDDATCVEGCTDSCDVDGETQCAGMVVETCTDANADGCLAWELETDCTDSGGYCGDIGDGAVCLSCDDRCPEEGASQCVGSFVDSCIADSNGCLRWEAETDCAVLDPVQVCQSEDGMASCAELSGSGSCPDPIEVGVAHFVLAGTDFTADFSDNQTFGGSGCNTRSGTPEVVFSLELSAGQTVRLREMSDFDAVLSLMTACDDEAECVFSEDFTEDVGYEYTASADGSVYAVVEPFDAEPRILYYDIRIDIIETEVCDNGVDDDADGGADCDDEECFGVGHCATAELNCGDSGDNDDDGATDCDDSDCEETAICGPYLGIYEILDYEEEMDLQGHALVLTPDISEPTGYTMVMTEISGFSVEPGSSASSLVVDLDDDDTELYTFTLLPEFPFYGARYRVLFLSSNGYITLGDWEILPYPSLEEFFELPTIAALWTDLAPHLASTTGAPVVTIDEFPDHLVVTFEDTPIWYDEMSGMVEAPNDFQMILHADGRIELVWVTVNTPFMDTIIGISNGIGRGEYPAEVDLVP